ncbi:MAG: hypothetical protein GXO40_05810 [Epsilonproteobacteria bacterium]|nr:hypothetical protein [Campylobacterota bacterium]
MRELRYRFWGYFVAYYLVLLYYAYYMDVGTVEIKYLLEHRLLFLFETSLSVYNNLLFRLPSLVLSALSLLLYYQIAKKYLSSKDAALAIVIFSLMPGFIIASLLCNKSIYLIFLVILFIWSFLYYRFAAYVLLLLYTVVNYSFIFLYLSLFFYAVYKKDARFMAYSIILFAINANYFNYDIAGHPRGYFVELLLVYLAIFSPFVFIYFLYSLIKTQQKSLLWFISFVSLGLSILLSFRQQIKIDDFAPFVIVYVVFMVRVFLYNYRIRLKIFRSSYRMLFGFLLGSLLVFDMFILSSPYVLHENIVTQFRYTNRIYKYLKTHNIDSVYCNDELFCKKLYFYGLKKGRKYYLLLDEKHKKVSIFHNQKKISQFFFSK